MALSIGTWQILTSCGAETTELISVKLEIYDYVWDATPHDKFGGGALTKTFS